MMTLFPDSSRVNDGLLEIGNHKCVNEKGQCKLTGSICCPQIPFILVMTSQSHLSPLLDLYSANPQEDPKTHYGTNAVVLIPLS